MSVIRLEKAFKTHIRSAVWKKCPSRIFGEMLKTMRHVSSRGREHPETTSFPHKSFVIIIKCFYGRSSRVDSSPLFRKKGYLSDALSLLNVSIDITDGLRVFTSKHQGFFLPHISTRQPPDKATINADAVNSRSFKLGVCSICENHSKS